MSTGPLQFMAEKSLSGRDHNGEIKGKDIAEDWHTLASSNI